ncbi:hypothetical protein BMS3Bbin07_00315 [bacterium BMS3Bbin07]|nr:hypothetical protein BMS3Bbin07_00315 [bacterium BMS3Bbin07]GMT48157.1 MAG: hypothetical protein IEMM0007_1723 [bacterium]HDH01959.1 hypothetical protein [Nitrospirota bacterium]
MIQVDIPGAIAAGQIYALLSKKYLKNEGDRFTHRLAGPVSWYFALFFAPVGLFLLVGWPAWESMYWWEWIERPAFNPPVAFFYIAFYLSMIILGNLSYFIAHTLYRNGRDGTVKLLSVLSVIATLLPFILWPFTWYRIGTYKEFHAVPKETTTLFNTPSFFWSWLAIMGYFVVTSVIFGIWIKRFSGKIAEQP